MPPPDRGRLCGCVGLLQPSHALKHRGSDYVWLYDVQLDVFYEITIPCWQGLCW
jgi:hypothetical protein